MTVRRQEGGWLLYDVELLRPACVLLQAVAGGDRSLLVRFPSETWLTAPTAGMRRVRVQNNTELARLLEATQARKAGPARRGS